jgi:hypothetical protein
MELNFQWSGEVSDKSALEIGKFLGARTIVTGTISELADRHRLRIRALDVETAEVQGQYNRNISASRTIAALMKGGRTSSLAYGQASAGGRTASGNNSTSGNDTSNASGTSNARQAATAQPQTPAQQAPAQPQTPLYKIGDTGPAGGLIFYDKGNNIGGWRYLEAAPADLGPTSFLTESPDSFPRNLYELWERTVDNKGREIGKGKYNSEYLMQIAQTRGGFGWAVYLCDIYEHGGFSDWFVPSRDELNFMYGNLYLRGLGNFRPEQY